MYVSRKLMIAFVGALSLLVAAPLVQGAQRPPDERGGALAAERDRGGPFDRLEESRWALVDEAGTIVQQTGGFRIVDCYRTNANCYIAIGEDATDEGLGATIANQNNVAGQAVSLTGEIGVGACGSSLLNCAPPGTENDEVIVVTPRNSDGSTTTPGARKRFYVEVIGPDAR